MNSATFILSSACFSVTIIGLLLNAFTVIPIFIWRLKGQALQTIDIIMTSLGVVRIILLALSLKTLANVISLFLRNYAFKYYISGLTFVEFCSLWWGTVLCVFYCAKITNYSNRLFMRLKMNISRMVPWLLLTSLLMSFLSSLPNIRLMYSVHCFNSTCDSNSSSNGNVTVGLKIIHLFTTFSTGSLVPFLIFCAAICLLITSLLKHTRNMRSKDSGFTNIQLDAHMSTIRNMLSFLFLYAVYVVNLHLMLLCYQSRNSSYVLLCGICLSACPSLHSLILIASNARLKRSLRAALCCTGTSYLKKYIL